MRKLANDIQAVINTLSGLEIKATPATIERLYGCFGVLANTRNELNRMADEQDAALAPKEVEVKPDGTADPE